MAMADPIVDDPACAVCCHSLIQWSYLGLYLRCTKGWSSADHCEDYEREPGIDDDK